MKSDRGTNVDDEYDWLSSLHWQSIFLLLIFLIFLTDSTIVNVNVPIINDRGIAKNNEYWNNNKSTVSAVSMQALSAVMSITIDDLKILFIWGLYKLFINYTNPFLKLRKVATRLKIKPLFASSSSKEQQPFAALTVDLLSKSYLPKMAIKVEKPAKAYPII